MDSIQTKTKNYVDIDGKCIAQVMAVAEKNGFRIYVAWEWHDMAKQGMFGFIKSQKNYESVTEEAINETADYGFDIGGTGEEKKIFKNLF
jgi:hypothetical protein